MATAELPQREALADAVCDWVLRNGVSGLSLRPLARDLGISTYPLMYWFGSKQGVIAAALERSEERQMAMVERWAQAEGALAPGRLFRRYWRWSTSSAGRPYVRLFVELAGLAQRSPEIRVHVDRAQRPWRDFFDAVLERSDLEPAQKHAQSTLFLATVTGLQLDLGTTGDVKRTSEAAEVLAAELDTLGELPLP